MHSQLSGHGGRKAQLHGVCQLLYDKREVTEADCDMQTVCSEEVCLRDLLVEHILESPETLNVDPDKCCSVCTNGAVPIVYVVHSAPSRR